MKRTLTCIVILTGLFLTTSYTHAQSGRLSVGAELALPMGDFADATSMGYGGSLRYEMPMGDNLGLMGTAGYIMFGGKDDGPDWAMIPVQLGLKYYFSENQGGLYGAVHVGIHSFSTGDITIDDGMGGTYTIEGASSTDLSYAPELGFHMAKLDLGVRYQFIATEGETTSYLGLRLAFVFGER